MEIELLAGDNRILHECDCGRWEYRVQPDDNAYWIDGAGNIKIDGFCGECGCYLQFDGLRTHSRDELSEYLRKRREDARSDGQGEVVEALTDVLRKMIRGISRRPTRTEESNRSEWGETDE